MQHCNILTDMDGTLVDTEKIDGVVLKRILSCYGLRFHEEFSGCTLDEYLSKVVEDRHLKRKIKKEFLREYGLELKRKVLKVNEQLLSVIQRTRNCFKVGLVTSNNKRLTKLILKLTGLDIYFG